MFEADKTCEDLFRMLNRDEVEVSVDQVNVPSLDGGTMLTSRNWTAM